MHTRATLPATWTPIGTEKWGSEMLYLVEVSGQLMKVRQSQILAAHQLLAIDPDVDRWRRMFPHPARPAKFDSYAAGAFVMRECIAAQQRRTQSSAPAAE